jgi:hypothetical protein
MLAKLVIVAVFAVSVPVHAQEPEQPQKVDICTLLADPLAYHHKLVVVTGRVSRGFENFTLRGAACSDALPLWVEYGGPQPAEVVYCCAGDQEHPPNGKDPLWIDGTQTSLNRDGVFRRFDSMTKRLRRGRTVKATLVGRVFSAGTYTSDSGEEVEVGYGHFGMHSLFVVQRVLEVAR